MENKKFTCVNAFNNLSVNSTGSVKHCCMINGGTVSGVLDTPIEVLWQDPYMLEIRDYFKKGIRHPACSKCWNEEDAGRKSKRIRDNEQFDFKEEDGIKTIELNMGNTCNIKCRTCHPYSSSQWIKEYYDTWESHMYPAKTPRPDFKIYLEDSKRFNRSWEAESPLWETLERIGKNLTRIDFYGGEPWLIKQQWNFLRKCVEMGWSKNMSLHYNTNGTQWDEELLVLFDSFKFVDVGFSIDGINEQFEFMRHPAKWDVVYGNMKKAKEWSKNRDNIQFGICHTISALNVYYIPEFIEFFHDDWHIYLNLVHFPDHYCVQVFPDDIKEKICKKLETVDKHRYGACWDQLQGIIQFVKGGRFKPYFWDKFLLEVDTHDKYRNEDYYKTFKEFGEIIRLSK